MKEKRLQLSDTRRVLAKDFQHEQEIDISWICCADHECFSGHLETLFAFSPPRVTLPFLWGPDSNGGRGEAVADPLTLYIHLPFGEDGPDGDSVDFYVPLGDVLDDFIDAVTIRDGSGAVVDSEERAKVQALADALRKHAAELDDILKRKPKG